MLHTFCIAKISKFGKNSSYHSLRGGAVYDNQGFNLFKKKKKRKETVFLNVQ